MKLLSSLLAVLTAGTLLAGVDLPIDGKLRQVKKGIPVNWQISPDNAARIVRGEDWFSKALQLSAAQKPATAATKLTYPVTVYDKVEIEAEIKGRGSAFFVIELLDINGKVVAAPRIAAQIATGRFEDMKGKLYIRDYKHLSPVAIRIVCGVTPGSTVAFDDIDAELDRD